ncbi:Amino acid transporter, transmembrane domain [Cinara cedri]|uniref:Amino acid transporter, transmembrane domain n=1 Tax=Cinara cedri TaxID=506608 RepID=A0A5E4N0Z8_9HEMI|nr:Amino acid transporter, transmembrane domain [Cinara cedri]
MPTKPDMEEKSHPDTKIDMEMAPSVIDIESNCKDTRERSTTFSQSIFHLVKASLGTGILAMPSAFKNAGYMVGILGTIVIGAICTYTIHILTNSSTELSKTEQNDKGLNYAETVEAAFRKGPIFFRKYAKLARFVTDTLIVLYQLGSNCIYIVFISENIKAVVDVYTDGNTDVRMCMFAILIPLWSTIWLKDFKVLSPFSTIVTYLTMASFTIIFYYIFRDMPSLEHRNKVGTASNIPLALGTVLFAMEAIGAILPLLNDMKYPERFSSKFGVINVSLIPIAGLYAFIGFFGYLRYGEETKGSITLDLPSEEIPAQITKLILSLSIFICYALSNLISYDIFEKFFDRTCPRNKNVGMHILRTSTVLITFILAGIFANLEDMIALIGTLCLSTVGVALPAIINQLTFYEHYRKQGKWRYVIFCLSNLAIVLVAIFALVVGMYKSVTNIMNTMEK